ncbi:MAG: ethanolamine ammonia-lyase subunit EutC [Cellulosilyticaceae bacterium]
MNEQDLRRMVEQLVEQMVGKEGSSVTTAAPTSNSNRNNTTTIDPSGCIEDVTKIDLKKQLLVDNAIDKSAYLDMKSKTPARLGIGKAGARYKTITMLRVRADHAAAQDAVFSDVSEDFIKKNKFVFVQTKCKDKDEYLTRPDLGRRFNPEELDIIKKTCGQNPKVLIIVGDGLSSSAIEANVEDMIPAIEQGLKMYGITVPPIVFIKYARVGAMDDIGQATDADVICMLVGERPGLVTAESMSAYIAYKPKHGLAEAKRTVISNIHKGGTTAVEAGAHAAELIKKMLDKKASGIDLK